MRRQLAGDAFAEKRPRTTVPRDNSERTDTIMRAYTGDGIHDPRALQEFDGEMVGGMKVSPVGATLLGPIIAFYRILNFAQSRAQRENFIALCFMYTCMCPREVGLVKPRLKPANRGRLILIYLISICLCIL